MKIALGTDHAGFSYKERIKQYLLAKDIEIVDFGTDSAESCDYPDFIIPAAQAVAEGKCDFAFVLGGSGNGEAIAANKVKNIRCAVVWNELSAEMARRHNNANVMSLGERMIAREALENIVETWLRTPYDGDRHQRRINKITDFETL